MSQRTGPRLQEPLRRATGKTPTPRELAGMGPTRRNKDRCLGGEVSSELVVPLPAASARGLGAEASIWPRGGAGRPGCVEHPTGGRGPRGGGRREDHFLQPSVHRPPEVRRRGTKGSTGGALERRDGGVRGSGRAGGRCVGWQGGAHLVVSNSASGGAGENKPASGPLTLPLTVGPPRLYFPQQFPTLNRKIPRDQAPELSLGSRDNKILVHKGGAICLPSLHGEAGERFATVAIIAKFNMAFLPRAELAGYKEAGRQMWANTYRGLLKADL